MQRSDLRITTHKASGPVELAGKGIMLKRAARRNFDASGINDLIGGIQADRADEHIVSGTGNGDRIREFIGHHPELQPVCQRIFRTEVIKLVARPGRSRWIGLILTRDGHKRAFWQCIGRGQPRQIIKCKL